MKLSPRPTKSSRGFTLIEISISVMIIALLVGIAVAALSDSKSESTTTGAEGTAKTLNDAIVRAKLAGDEDPRIVGEEANDTRAAIEYLKNKGYID